MWITRTLSMRRQQRDLRTVAQPESNRWMYPKNCGWMVKPKTKRGHPKKKKTGGRGIQGRPFRGEGGRYPNHPPKGKADPSAEGAEPRKRKASSRRKGRKPIYKYAPRSCSESSSSHYAGASAWGPTWKVRQISCIERSGLPTKMICLEFLL